MLVSLYCQTHRYVGVNRSVEMDGDFFAEPTDFVFRGLALLERKIGRCGGISYRLLLLLFLAAGLFVASPDSAQGWTSVPSGVLSTISGFLPFGGTGSETEEESPFFFPPYFGGEARVRLLGLQTSKATLQTPFQFFNFKDSLGLSNNIALMEGMFRLQFSRVSVRLHVTSKLSDYSSPDFFSDLNSGVRYRIGGDLDLFQRIRSRFGVCLDYDLDTPLFRAVIGNQLQNIEGQQAVTLGTYAVYNPTFSWCRYSVIAEARFR